jgi:hypothetical protein
VAKIFGYFASLQSYKEIDQGKRGKRIKLHMDIKIKPPRDEPLDDFILARQLMSKLLN